MRFIHGRKFATSRRISCCAEVFETCETYVAAKSVLEETPVARPVIYTLIGCATGERCVIERTENGFVTREEKTSATNDWVPSRPRWKRVLRPAVF